MSPAKPLRHSDAVEVVVARCANNPSDDDAGQELDRSEHTFHSAGGGDVDVEWVLVTFAW